MSTLSSVRSARAAGAAVPFALLVAFLALITPPASAADVILSPTADTFVSASESAGNYGGAGAVEVSAPGSLNGEFQGLLLKNQPLAKPTFANFSHDLRFLFFLRPDGYETSQLTDPRNRSVAAALPTVCRPAPVATGMAITPPVGGIAPAA